MRNFIFVCIIVTVVLGGLVMDRFGQTGRAAFAENITERLTGVAEHQAVAIDTQAQSNKVLTETVRDLSAANIERARSEAMFYRVAAWAIIVLVIVIIIAVIVVTATARKQVAEGGR